MAGNSESAIDPSDSQMRRHRDEERASRRQTRGYISLCRTRIAGGRFAAIGAYGAAMAVGYFDHPPLMVYWREADLLWSPAVALGLFVLCYAVFYALHVWYVRNPPEPDLLQEPVRAEVWLPLGVGLGALVLAGSILGLTACTAALTVGVWVLVCRLVIGTTWKPYTLMAVLLIPAGAVPPLLGWPMPNLLPTLFLSAISGTMIVGGILDHAQYHRFVTKTRIAREV